MARIIIPTPLRKFTDNQSSVDIQGVTIKDAVRDLTTLHPSLSRHLLDEQGNIRSFIRIYLGEDDINTLEKEATPIGNESTISIVPAIAGG